MAKPIFIIKTSRPIPDETRVHLMSELKQWDDYHIVLMHNGATTEVLNGEFKPVELTAEQVLEKLGIKIVENQNVKE